MTERRGLGRPEFGRKLTERQMLKGHLLDRHGDRLTVLALERMTLKDMQRWHEEDHTYPRDHAHEDGAAELKERHAQA